MVASTPMAKETELEARVRRFVTDVTTLARVAAQGTSHGGAVVPLRPAKQTRAEGATEAAPGSK